MESEGSRTWQYLACLSANLASICVGQVFTWSSPGLQKLKGEKWQETSPLSYEINLQQETWIASLAIIGAIFGPSLAFILVDTIGRKKTLLACAIPYITGWVLMATTSNLVQIYVARLVQGFSVGATFSTLPVYVGEISDKQIRGAMGALLQLFLTFGFMISFTVGPFVSFRSFALISCIVPVVLLISFSFMPESPYHYLKNDNEEDAAEVLMQLRGKPNEEIQTELFEMKAYVETARQLEWNYSDLCTNNVIRKSLILTIILLVFQQLTGINAVLAYTEDIFKAATGNIRPEINSIIIGLVQVVASCFGPCVADRLGRKILLQMSGLGMAIGLFFLGLYFMFADRLDMDVSALQFLPICSMMLFVISFCFGFGAIPWVVIAELFPSHIKSLASTVLGTVASIVGFLVIKGFPGLLKAVGTDFGFWFFGVCTFLSAVYTTIFLPETKGKSLQEIQEILDQGVIVESVDKNGKV